MRVGQELEPLREQGWFVTHNLKMDWGGNLDHLVIGPAGAYAIETKSGRFRRADAAQAVRGAIWAKQKFGQPWVTAVLCVGTDPPERPEQRGDTWVLSPALLPPWLLASPPRERRQPKPQGRP